MPSQDTDEAIMGSRLSDAQDRIQELEDEVGRLREQRTLLAGVLDPVYLRRCASHIGGAAGQELKELALDQEYALDQAEDGQDE